MPFDIQTMTDLQKVEALVDGGLAGDEQEAVAMLIDCGEFEWDGTVEHFGGEC